MPAAGLAAAQNSSPGSTIIAERDGDVVMRTTSARALFPYRDVRQSAEFLRSGAGPPAKAAPPAVVSNRVYENVVRAKAAPPAVVVVEDSTAPPPPAAAPQPAVRGGGSTPGATLTAAQTLTRQGVSRRAASVAVQPTPVAAPPSGASGGQAPRQGPLRERASSAGPVASSGSGLVPLLSPLPPPGDEAVARTGHYAAVAREGRHATQSFALSPPRAVVATEGDGHVAFADRHLSAADQETRSREIAKLLRRVDRWMRVDRVAEMLNASPPQVCAVIAGDLGCRYLTGAWYGDYWVRAHSREERHDALIQAAAAEEAASAGRDPPPSVAAQHEAAEQAMAEDNRGASQIALRPLVIRPWVATGIATEGVRGDGAPTCGAQLLRDRRLREEATAAARARQEAAVAGRAGVRPAPAHADPPRAKVSRGAGGGQPTGSGSAASSSGAVRPNVPAPGTAMTCRDRDGRGGAHTSAHRRGKRFCDNRRARGF